MDTCAQVISHIQVCVQNKRDDILINLKAEHKGWLQKIDEKIMILYDHMLSLEKFISP